MSAPIFNFNTDAFAALLAERVADELEARAKRRERVLFTPEEMAAALRVTEKTLANQRSRGVGPKFIKVGSRVRYPVDPSNVQP